MITTLADQYLAQNAGRRYPLADDAGYDDVVDDSAILDFRCTVRGVPAGTCPRAYITSIAGTSGKTVTVLVVRQGGNDVLSFYIPSNIATNATYTTTATNSTTKAEGVITVSASVLALAAVSNKRIPLAWSTVICDSLKVHSIRSAQETEDATDDTDPQGQSPTAELSGEIVLAEGRNTEPYLDGNRLRVDIVKGGGLGERCQSAVSGGQRCGTVLFTINGEHPGSDGDVKIVGDDGVSVIPVPDEHAIEIRMDEVAADRVADECAKTCE